jgi:hypothetical protein
MPILTRTGHDIETTTQWSADSTSPTTQDVRTLAFDLQKVYAQKTGAIPTPPPLVIHFDGNMTLDDLRSRMSQAGIELFPDYAGNTCARTVEVGNLHRELVKAERQTAYLEKNPDMAPYVRTEIVGFSRFEPPITREVPIPDPDREAEQDWQDKADRSL